jgi:hypothetical protein
MTTRDWHDWHLPYADPASPLSRRLALIRAHVGTWLDERPGPVTVLSVCAGQGHDLLGVLASRKDAGRVRACLIEYDARNVALARQHAAGLSGVQVRHADAGLPGSYQGAAPADLVLLAGVLGNVGDADARHIVATLPALCTAGATVIWTRTRRPPDLTPDVRRWFAAREFTEVAFHAPHDVLFSVGVHRFDGVPQALPADGGLFRFVR